VTGKIEVRRIRKWSTQILNYINAMNLCIKNLDQKISEENDNPTLPLGVWGSVVVKALRCVRSRDRFPVVSLDFQ
jgi:hypothetical protein